VSDEKRKGPSPEDAELEREIRSKRKYSLDEAIGRAAGDLMKGTSPVTHKRQAELEIEQFLERHLDDTEGALTVVLQRRVREGEDLLERSYEDPLAALAEVTERLLARPESLRSFVRLVDAEWGRIYSERPYFEVGEAPPRAGDPYTIASVRQALSALLDSLRGEADS